MLRGNGKNRAMLQAIVLVAIKCWNMLDYLSFLTDSQDRGVPIGSLLAMERSSVDQTTWP